MVQENTAFDSTMGKVIIKQLPENRYEMHIQQTLHEWVYHYEINHIQQKVQSTSKHLKGWVIWIKALGYAIAMVVSFFVAQLLWRKKS